MTNPPGNPPVGLKSLAAQQTDLKVQFEQQKVLLAKLEERITALTKKVTDNETQINQIVTG